MGVLKKALAIVQERELMYGHPADHWERTAAIATALLAPKLRPGETVTAEDWGRMMAGDKLVRDTGPDAGDDQIIDAAGYVDGIGRIRDRERGRA